MKTLKNILKSILVALLVLLVGCEKEQVVLQQRAVFSEVQEYKLSVSSGSDTKVAIDGASVKWKSGDKINVIKIASNNKISGYSTFTIDANSISQEGKTADFYGSKLVDGASYYAVTGSDVTYSSSQSSITVKSSINAQTANGSYSHINNSLFMYSPIFVAERDETIGVKFNLNQSILNLNLKLKEGLSDEVKIKKVEFKAGEKGFINEWKMLADGSITPVSSSASNSVSININGSSVISSSQDYVVNIPIWWDPSVSNTSGSYTIELTLEDGRTIATTYPVNKALTVGRIYSAAAEFDAPEPVEPPRGEDANDGYVVELQSATVGAGINVVILGDGFIAEDMGTGGKYDQIMREAMEHFFSEEPYKTYRNRFNVYYVNAISENTNVGDGASTIFKSLYGSGTRITGDNDMIFEYAKKVPSITDLFNLTVINVLNDTKYAGTCSLYGGGLDASISYCPIANNDSETFRQVIIHEASGHGFGKLFDEYSNSGTGTIPSNYVSNFETQVSWGWGANTDLTDNPNNIKWSHFLNNSSYDGLVGIYEGGYTFEKGVYRPTEYSIMKYNTGGFNAPSREAIYKYIMEISGDTYSRAKFLEYDAVNTSAQSRASYKSQTAAFDESTFIPLAPPIIFNEAPNMKK